MRLTDSDSGFLYGESANAPLQTAGVLILDGEATFQEIYQHYASRIHLVPMLRRRLAWVPMNLAHPTWVDDPEFDLAKHIVHHELPPGTDLEHAVDIACELNEGVMRRDRPLWKFFVITGVPDRTLVLQQIHHALVDGASAVHLSTVMLDYQPDAEPPPPPTEPWNPDPLPSPMTLAAEAMRENAEKMAQMNPMRLMRFGTDNQQLLSRGSDVMARFLTRPAITAPWNASLLGPKRKLRWSTYEFAEFKEIRRAFGGTINDVVLTAITEGAARYLDDHNEYNTGQYFRLMCPVNVRTEDEAGALGNRVSAMFPTLPAWAMHPVDRLAHVCEETERIKSAGEAQALTLMQESGLSFPPVALAPLQMVGSPFDPTAWMASNPLPVPPRLGPRPPNYAINMVVTNVPGVQVPQYVAGYHMIDQVAIMMLSGTIGYAVVVGSFNQKMVLNYTCDPRLLPDVEKMVEYTEQAHAELLEAARNANNNAA